MSLLLVTAGLGLSVTSSATAASSASCVAVVVDATALGGSVSTGCDRGHPGATGIDVLSAAGYTLTFRQDGLLCTINDLPSSGCSGVDSTHYWAYYHRAPGATSWSYSNEGPATYQPSNGSTEGWVYRDGTLRPPRNVPYSQICGQPAATPKPHHTTRAVSTPSTLPRHLPTHSARPLPPRSTPTIAPHPKATIVPEPRRHHAGSTTPYPTFSGSPPHASPSRSQLPTSVGSSGGHGGVIGAIIAAIIVIALAGAAVVTNRRRRG